MSIESTAMYLEFRGSRLESFVYNTKEGNIEHLKKSLAFLLDIPVDKIFLQHAQRGELAPSFFEKNGGQFGMYKST